MKFKIVDGNYDDLDGIDYESLKKDYLDPEVTVESICEKHSITRRRFYRIKKQLVEDTGVARKPTTHRGIGVLKRISANITQDSKTKKFRVAKFVDGKLLHFGGYTALQEAVEVRNIMEEHDWDIDYYHKHIKPSFFKKRMDEPKDKVYEDFVNDYLKGETMNTLLEKYGITKYRYHQLATSIKHEFGIFRKPQLVKT